MFANNDLLVLTPPLAIFVLAVILVVAWLAQRSQRFLLWQACAYSLTALTLGAQTLLLLTLEELNRYALLIGSCYLLSAWCLARSWAERWRVSTQPQVC